MKKAKARSKVKAKAVAIVSGLSVSPLALTVRQGEVAALAAVVRDAKGREVAGATITYESTSLRTATVDTSGRVTGVRGGTVVVTATHNGKSVPCTVTVD